ncbi:hypothetical protein [Novosphingobium sp. HII-3]|uniref:hypothetical protein n=1 Tax=Novosphingobium sp. HII-3 TaxID=2075565 RepID=UPI001304EC7B|nr:hypothetical protein [Novosphingobium sp. HII-3]
MFMRPGELSRPATIGVLNALASDGYLNRHQKSYTRAIWTAENILECADRLEVFVQISTTRVVAEKGPRLIGLQRLAGVLVDTDPKEEAFYLRSMEWMSILFRAGERRTIAEVVYKLIPQAFYRHLFNLMVGRSALRTMIAKVARFNRDSLNGDIAHAHQNQAEVYSNLRRAIDIALSQNPAMKFDLEALSHCNNVREPDIRDRTLAMSHPYYPLYLSADRAPGVARNVVA